jgi:tetratricopeptide (TPR) repeat protein
MSTELIDPEVLTVPQKDTFRKVVLALLVVLTALFASPTERCHAQDSSGVAATAAKDIAELKKALKYHKALQRRPSPGYLFDRFYDSWLDSASLEELQSFLTEEVDASSQTADRLLLAFFFAKQGDDVAALQQFREALKNDPGNAATLYEKAVVESRTLDFESALTDLANAAKSNPSAEDAIKIAQLRGKLLVRNRQTEEAVKVWQELINANPGDESLMEDMIELQIGEGLYEQAEELSVKLIEITKDPFQKVVRKLRKGDIYQRAGKRSKALAVYGETLAQVGTDSWLEREILGQIDQLFRREDDLIGLGEHLKGLVKADSKRMSLRKALSKVEMELGLVDEAIKSFEGVIELTPGDRSNREAFVSLLIRAEKTDKAVKQMEALVTQHPEDAELRIQLANLCHKVDAKDKAKQAVEKFVELSGGSEYGFLRGARLFEKFGDKENAAAIYEKAVAALADSDSIKEAWASFLVKTDQPEKAIEIWNEIAKQSDRAGLVRIARVASTRKQNQAAMEMLLARYDELKLDTIYLDQLCTEAIALKKFEQAIPWVLERVRLSKTSGDVEAFMNSAIQIVASAGKLDATLAELKSKPNRNTPETCFLIELMDRSMHSQEADTLLATSLETAAASNEKDAVQMLARQKVRLLIERQDWEAAAVAARDVIELPGGRKSVNVKQLVQLYARSNDQESALKWIEEWKRLSPGSLMPWLNEASLLDRIGKYKDSIAVLRSATRKFPDDPELFAQLANKYIESGKAADAERIYWRQYDESEKLSDKLRWAERLADVADDNGSIEELLEKFKERRKSNPQSIAPLLAIAQAHRIADNYEERRIALLEATRLQKDNLPLLLEIARLEESEGDWEKAIETLEKASLLDKTNRAKQNIARIYIEYGETKEGLARLLEVAGGANSSARDVEKIAVALVGIGDWEQLREFLEPQVLRFQDDYRLKFLLAITNEELGNVAIAKSQFVELLNNQQEVSSLTTPQNSMGYYQRRVQMLRGTLPEPAIEFMNLKTVFTEAAYSYQEDRSRGPYGMMGLGGTSAYLPSSVDDCRRYSLAHLTTLAAEYSDSESKGESKALRSELVRAGISDPDLMLSDMDQQSMFEEPGAILDTFPDNENALAIAIMGAMNQENADAEIAIKGYEKFKDTFPSLAFLAALNLDLAQKENQQRFETVLQGVKKLEKPNMSIVMAIARKTSQMVVGEEEGNEGLAKYQGQLNDLLAEWYPKLTQTQGASEWVFMQLVQSLRKEKSPKRFIEFLDKELDRSSTQQQSSPVSSYMISSYRGDEARISLPQFPPKSLPTFSPLVYSQLSLADEEDDFRFNPFSEVEPMTTAAIAESVPVAKNPILKTLLLVKYFQSAESERNASLREKIGSIEDVKTAIDQLLKTEKTNIDALYLAASFSASEQRWEDASAQFEKMRSLPMDASTRTMIDGHLVALATQGLVGQMKAKENEKVLLSAKSAALRMRRGRLTQQQRVGLVDVFETLGLADEAEKMESKIASRSGGGGSGGSGGFAMRAPKSRIAELADAGKSDAASRLLVQEFRSIARNMLDFNAMQNSSYELREFKSKLNDMELKKEFLEQLDPKESTTARKISIWAVALETFGEKEKAKQAYAKLLESNPKEDEARLRLLMMEIADGKTDAFADQYSKVKERNQPQFVNALIGSFSGRELGAEGSLDAVESILSFVESDKSKLDDMLWLERLLSSCTDSKMLAPNDYEYRTRPVYAKLPKATDTEEKLSRSRRARKEKIDALSARQRDLHDRIARIMIDVPEVAASGFTALLASNTAVEKEIDDTMVELALKSVYPPEKSSRSASQMQQYMMSSYSSMSYGGDEAEQVTMRSPVEFLARHYGFDSADHSQQIESIATKLDSLKAKADAAKLRGTYQLCKADEKEFAALATQQVEAVKKASRRPDEEQWQASLSTVLDVWSERKLDVDISELVLEFASRDQSGSGYPGYYGGQRDLSGSYVSEIAKRQSSEAAVNFLGKLRTRLIGDEAKQKEVAELLSDPKKAQRNRRKLMKVGRYLSTVRQLTDLRETFFIAIEEGNRFRMPGGGNSFSGNFRYQFQQLAEAFEPDEAQEFLDWLGQTSFLEDLENFDPIQGDSSGGGEESFWGSALEGFSYQIDGKLKKNVAEILSSKKDPSFGESLLLAFCKENPPIIYDKIGEQLEVFESLNEERQLKLATFAKQLNSMSSRGGRNRRPETENGRRVKTLCFAKLNRLAGNAVKKLMEAKRFRDLGVDAYEFEEWAGDLLSSLDTSDTDKVLEVIRKLSKLGENAQASNPFGYGESSFQSELVSLAVTNAESDSIKILLKVLDSEDFGDFAFNDELSESLQEFLSQEFALAKRQTAKDVNAKEPKKQSGVAAVRAIDAFQNQLGNKFGDRSLFSFIPFFQRMYTSMDEAEFKALDEWFALEPAGKYPKIGSAMRLAWLSTRDYLKRKQSESNDEEADFKVKVERFEEMEPYQAALVAFLKDDTNTIQSRLPVALSLPLWDKQLPLDGVWSSCDLVTKALEAKAKLGGQSLSGLFQIALEYESADAFTKSAGGLAKAWADSKSLRASQGYYSSGDDRTLVDVIRILSKTDNERAVKKLLLSNRNSNGPSLLVALIESDLLSEARNRCRSLWAEDDIFESTGYNKGAFSKSVEEKLPKFIELFKDDGGKYFAELFFASMENSKVQGQTVSSTVDSRLEELSKRFSSVDFRSKRHQKQSLILLSNSSTTAAVIREPLAELAKDLKIEELMESDESELPKKLLASYLAVESQLGNHEPLKTVWWKINGVTEANAVGESPYENNWQVRQFIESISGSASAVFGEKLETASPEEIQEMLPLLQSLNAPTLTYPLCPGVNAIAHLAAGKADDLIAAYNAVPSDEEDEESGSSNDMDSFLEEVKKWADKSKIKDSAARAKLVTDVWNIGAKCKFSIGSGHYQDGVQESCSGCSQSKFGIEQLAELKLLSDAQILEVGPTLAELNSVNGEVWRQVAKRQFEAQQFEQAAESFRKALEGTTEEMKQASVNRRVEYANALVKIGQRDKAAEQLEEIESGQLLGDNPAIWEELKVTLDIK